MKQAPLQNGGHKIILWDVDNTIWNWAEWGSKAYPAMAKAISEETRVELDEVIAGMRNYYTRAGTVESSWLIQDLERQGVIRAEKRKMEQLIRDVSKVFNATRQKNLGVYNGIPESLKQAQEDGFRNIILTDAPAFHAASRIRHLHMNEGYFEGMIALKDSLPNEIPPKFKHKYENGAYGLDFPVVISDREKPHTRLEEILGVSDKWIQDNLTVIGDNWGKDMALASLYECPGLHAGWGEIPKEQLRVIKKFAPDKISQKNAPRADETRSVPSNIIKLAHPSEISFTLGKKPVA